MAGPVLVRYQGCCSRPVVSMCWIITLAGKNRHSVSPIFQHFFWFSIIYGFDFCRINSTTNTNRNSWGYHPVSTLNSDSSAETELPLHLLVQETKKVECLGILGHLSGLSCQYDHFQVVAILRHVGLKRKLKTELVGNHTSFFIYSFIYWWQGLAMYLSQAGLQPPNRQALLHSP